MINSKAVGVLLKGVRGKMNKKKVSARRKDLDKKGERKESRSKKRSEKRRGVK